MTNEEKAAAYEVMCKTLGTDPEYANHTIECLADLVVRDLKHRKQRGKLKQLFGRALPLDEDWEESAKGWLKDETFARRKEVSEVFGIALEGLPLGESWVSALEPKAAALKKLQSFLDDVFSDNGENLTKRIEEGYKKINRMRKDLNDLQPMQYDVRRALIKKLGVPEERLKKVSDITEHATLAIAELGSTKSREAATARLDEVQREMDSLTENKPHGSTLSDETIKWPGRGQLLPVRGCSHKRAVTTERLRFTVHDWGSGRWHADVRWRDRADDGPLASGSGSTPEEAMAACDEEARELARHLQGGTADSRTDGGSYLLHSLVGHPVSEAAYQVSRALAFASARFRRLSVAVHDGTLPGDAPNVAPEKGKSR